jgi:hypothetical protein
MMAGWWWLLIEVKLRLLSAGFSNQVFLTAFLENTPQRNGDDFAKQPLVKAE